MANFQIQIFILKIFNWVENPSDYILISRFLGITVQTSSIFKTYTSIALQLLYTILNLSNKTVFRNNYDKYTKCQDIYSIKTFISYELKQIKRISPNKKVILILDSLNQLTTNDYKHIDKWFFSRLPSNLKFIVSTIPGHGNLLTMIENIIMKTKSERLSQFKNSKLNKQEIVDSFLLRINELDPIQCELILNKWLNTADRNLTETQWDELRKLFKNGKIIELFLKLVYDVVVRTSSFDKFNEDFLKCAKCDDIILYMFKNFEKIHGTNLFRRAICYMTLCKNGLGDNEIEDLLSLGEVFFNFLNLDSNKI